MSEQSDIPDWLKALRPPAAEPAPPESAFAQAPEESAPAEQAPTPPSPPSEFELLRERALAQPEEFEPEEGVSGSALLQVIRSLKPQQRFILAFFLLVNVSTLGCFVLMVLQKIDPLRIAELLGR